LKAFSTAFVRQTAFGVVPRALCAHTVLHAAREAAAPLIPTGHVVAVADRRSL
jgi:hypothetical protein